MRKSHDTDSQYSYDRLLDELNHLIHEEYSLREIFQILCRRLVEGFGCPWALVGIKKPDGTVNFEANVGVGEKYIQHFFVRWDDTPEGQGAVGRAIRTSSSQVFKFANNPIFDVWSDIFRELKLKSVAAIPLTIHEEPIGVLLLYSYDPNFFTATRVKRLESFAVQVAIAIAGTRNREQLNLYRELFEHSRDVILFTTREGKIIDANKLAEQVYGYTRQELCSMSVQQLRAVSERELIEDQIRVAFEEGVLFETSHLCKNGRIIPVEVNSYKVSLDGQEVLMNNIRDISERKLAEQILRRSQEQTWLEKEKAQVTLNSIGDAVITTDVTGKVEFLNPVAEQLTGWPLAEAKGKPLLDIFKIVNENTLQPAPDPVARCLNEGKVVQLTNHTLLISRSGSSLAIEDSAAPIRDRQGNVIGSVLVFHDVSEKRKLITELAYQAHHDALTSLPNRTLFKDRLSQALAQARRRNNKIGIMYIDLDRFKLVNDTYGHGAGDILLQKIAGRLTKILREEDTIARQGGDEFLILVPNIQDKEAVEVVAQRLLDSFSRPFHIYKQELLITPSIGISVYPNDGEDIETLIMRADMAMYVAKENGKHTYRFYDSYIGELASERLNMEMELNHAMEKGEFILHYQPKYSPFSGQITGIEALIRWQSPTRGRVSPADFIPVAEETGQIIAIGEWVLRTVCQNLKKMVKMGLPIYPIAVNISAVQFRRPDFKDLVLQIVAQNEISPSWLELEITESAAMENTSHTINILEELRGQGIRISIDDFGIGSSSLNYLRHLPIDGLKIDQSFIFDIESSLKGSEIVSAIIHLAHSLDLRVTAEGVETKGQLSLLKYKLCDEVQGFLFCKPVPWEELVALLTV